MHQGNKDDVCGRYMEIDVQVHRFKYYVKKAFWSVKVWFLLVTSVLVILVIGFNS